MIKFFEALTKRNWGAPFHAILVAFACALFISIHKPQNMNDRSMIIFTVLLFFALLVYELWQMKYGNQKPQGMVEDMAFNALGYIIGTLSLWTFTGNPESLFAALGFYIIFSGKKKLLICIDAGHGGHIPGATRQGYKEKNFNLDYALKLGKLLKSMGHKVIYTRTTDKALAKTKGTDLLRRAQFANNRKADLFISIHSNACIDPQAHGFELWTSRGHTNADLIASNIFKAVEDYFPDLFKRKDLTDGDVDFERDLSVLKYTAMPAVLVELAFMSNPDDLKMLLSSEYRENMPKAIVKGINKSIGG